MNEMAIKVSPIREILSCDNGFQIVLYREVDTDHTLTATGSNLSVHGTAILHGRYVNHKKYGKQFHVDFSEEIRPTGTDEMIDFLSYAKIKGVGRTIATRIVNTFGSETYASMENAEKLSLIRGISKERAKEIALAWKSLSGMQEYLKFFRELDLPVVHAKEAYEKYGNDIEQVRSRPYLLCCCGMSFGVVDGAMKRKHLLKPYDAERIMFGCMDVILSNEQNGNVFIQKESLIEQTKALLMQDLLLDAVEVEKGICYVVNQMCRNKVLVYQYDVLYRKAMYEAETFVAASLNKMIRRDVDRDHDKIMRAVEKAEKECGITLSDMQKQAIENALGSFMYIITGGPGTGKTTTLNVLIKAEMILKKDSKIELCAPTGRAARRMSENTSRDSSTIHSLLGIGVHSDALPENLLEGVDLIIADECSMIGLGLFATLLKAMEKGTRMILVGDVDQLESVEAGNVFSDLIASGVIPYTRLDAIFRQAEGSKIIENAIRVNSNNPPFIWEDECVLRQTYSEQETLEMLLQTVKDLSCDSKRVQILTPLKKRTELGTEKLNAHLQDVFNPPSLEKTELRAGNRIFRQGDKVMHLKNELEVSNGDIGYIKSVDPVNRKLMVSMENGTDVEYTSEDFPKLNHAFAMTIHKSQGSEYPIVILPFIAAFGGMRRRKLLYTAITRAKENLVVIGNNDSLAYAAGNVGPMRNSYLAYRLVELLQKDAEPEQLELF